MRLTILVTMFLLLAGCEIMPQSAQMSGPNLGRSQTVREFDQNGKLLRETESRAWAEGPSGSGAGLENWKIPTLGISDDGLTSGTGGSSWFNVAQITAAAGNLRPLYLMAGVAILAGVLIGWFAGWKLGLSVSFAGMGLLASVVTFDRYPWVLIPAAVLCVLAFVYLLLDLRDGKLNGSVLKTLVPVIDGHIAIKEEIAEATGGDKTFRKQVRKIKEKVGIA